MKKSMNENVPKLARASRSKKPNQNARNDENFPDMEPEECPKRNMNNINDSKIKIIKQQEYFGE